MSVLLDHLLVRTENVCGGRLRIDGTRLTVNQIVAMYRSGDSAEQIAAQYPHIDVGQIYAALAYYHANRSEVEQELADELSESERLKAGWSQLP